MDKLFIFEIIPTLVFLPLILFVLYHWTKNHYRPMDNFFKYYRKTGSRKNKKQYEPPRILYPSFYKKYEAFTNRRFYEGLNLQAELLNARGEESKAVNERIRVFNKEQEAYKRVWDNKFAEQGFDRRSGDFSRLWTISLLDEITKKV